MPFKKGQSGNPGGRPKKNADEIAAFERLGGIGGKVYVEKLHSLAAGPHDDANVRLRAITLILSYLWGEPIKRQEHTGAAGGPIPFTWQPPQSSAS